MKNMRYLVLGLVAFALSGFLVSFSAPVANASSSTIHVVDCPEGFQSQVVLVQATGDTGIVNKNVCYQGNGTISVDLNQVATICIGNYTGVAYYYDAAGNYQKFVMAGRQICYGHGVKQFPLYHVVSFQFTE